jgi:hypothetical protein
MRPILPDFTVHDFLKPQTNLDAVSNGTCKISLETQVTSKAIQKIEEIIDNLLISGDHFLENYIPVIGSTLIEAVSTNHVDKIRVVFKGKKKVIFEYTPVSESMWLEFLTTKSKGTYFNQKIKSNKDIKATRIV